MAFVEVPEEPMKQFVDVPKLFAKIGDRFDGIFVSDAENGRGYGQDYIFSVDGCSAACLTLKGALHGQLAKAKRDGTLKPGARVLIQFAKTTDVGKESPMKNYKVAVDPDYKGPAPKPSATFKLKQRAQTDAGFSPDEDAPF